jgi:ADP-L-glycero-D-manno-heptose 6-epimerase
MILVTGGAGFIGSNIVAALSERGREVGVSDRLRSGEKWRNLVHHEVADVIAPEACIEWLRRQGDVEAVIHMGAISATTESDVDRIVQNNIRLTLDLLELCTEKGIRLIYASSAATYGDGGAGFDDDPSLAALARLHPLNAYGWSKHVVDRRIARLRADHRPLPPQCVGLKFFNVYGPNEYHKGSMMSLITKSFPEVARGGAMRLFRSTVPELDDGGQQRDFIYVRDCVEAVLWFLDHPEHSGLFNLGTGTPRTWLDLARALFAACQLEPRIEFVDMPESLRAKYQNYTAARMERLAALGAPVPRTSLEEGIADYVTRFLATDDPFR